MAGVGDYLNVRSYNGIDYYEIALKGVLDQDVCLTSLLGMAFPFTFTVSRLCI